MTKESAENRLRDELLLLKNRFYHLSHAVKAFAEATTDSEKLFGTIAQQGSEVIRDYCLLLLRSEDREYLTPVGAYDPDPKIRDRLKGLFSDEPYKIDQHRMIQKVLETGRGTFIAQVDLARLRSNTTHRYGEFATQIGVHSLMVVPISQQSARIGIMVLARYRPDSPSFDENDVELAQILSHHAELAMGNARLLQRTQNELEERKKIEDHLQKSLEQLRKVEFRAAQEELLLHQNIVNHFFSLSLEMLCIAGPDGYFKYLNPAFDILGYEKSELMSQPFLAFVHPDDQASTLAEVGKLAAGERTIRFENRYRCKDGSYRWLAWTSTPDASGTIYAVARDITADRLAEEELRQAKETAEVSHHELEEFSYSMAHDLTTPLRSLDGFSKALLDDYGQKLDPQAREYLEHIRKSAQRMGHLIDDLLEVSRISRGKIVLEKVNLSDLANRIAQSLQKEDKTKRHVSFKIQEKLWARGDLQFLYTLLENLLDNAWKFTRKVAEAQIEVGSLQKEDETIYFVRDNGAGFNMAFEKKLFGVFQRLHNLREFEGSGVGLAAVQRIVRRHEGRIWAEGKVGKGATFYFTLGRQSGKQK